MGLVDSFGVDRVSLFAQWRSDQVFSFSYLMQHDIHFTFNPQFRIR